MTLTRTITRLCVTTAMLFSAGLIAKPLQYEDVFELEFVTEPQLNSRGDQIVFIRNWMDKQTDRKRSSLWLSSADGKQLQALTDKDINANSPRWSPDNTRLAFIANGQIHVKWLDTGRTTQLGQLTQVPTGLSWSPDGKWLAFSMFVPKAVKAPVSLPGKPEKADWAKAAIYIDSKQYRVR